MQRNEAYDAFTESTSGEYDTVQEPQAHSMDVDSNVPAYNNPTSSRQRMLSLWGSTTAAATVALIIAVVGVILGGRLNQDIQILQQELINLKGELASIQNGKKLVCITELSI